MTSTEPLLLQKRKATPLSLQVLLVAKYCSVTVVDSADNMVFGEVLYNSLNQVTLTFAGAFSGKAFFN